MTGPSVRKIDWNLIWSQWAHRGHRQHRREILNEFYAYAAPKLFDLVTIPLRALVPRENNFVAPNLHNIIRRVEISPHQEHLGGIVHSALMDVEFDVLG